MNKIIDIKQYIQLIKELPEHLLLATHKNPDPDGLASMFAFGLGLEAMGKKVSFIAEKPLVPMYHFFEEQHRLGFTPPAISDNPAERVLLTFDSSNLKIVSLPTGFELEKYRVVAVDHHITNTYEADYNLVNDHSASCSQIIMKILKEAEIEITPKMATYLYSGLVFDTGRFSYSEDPEVFLVAAELLKLKADHWLVYNSLYRYRNYNQFKLNAAHMSKIKAVHEGKTVYLELDQDTINSIDLDEAERIINQVSDIHGIEIVVIFKYMADGLTKLSFRSRGHYSVSEIATDLGGGGHLKASGAIVHRDFEPTKIDILQRIEQMLQKAPQNHNH